MNFPKGSSLHAYLTRSARFNKFFVQRTSNDKTKQSLEVVYLELKFGMICLKISGKKLWFQAAKVYQNYFKNIFTIQAMS